MKKSISTHFTLSALFSLFAFVVLTGCASTKNALPLPPYPATLDETQFNKNAPIEVYMDGYTGTSDKIDTSKLKKEEEISAYQKKIAISYIFDQLRTHGYTNIRSGAHFESKPLDKIPIIDVVACKSEDVKLRDLDAVESIIIVSVREPGKYVNNTFVSNEPRYFQAIGRANIGSAKRINAVSVSTSEAIRNLFRIKEFRQAISSAREN